LHFSGTGPPFRSTIMVTCATLLTSWQPRATPTLHAAPLHRGSGAPVTVSRHHRRLCLPSSGSVAGFAGIAAASAAVRRCVVRRARKKVPCRRSMVTATRAVAKEEVKTMPDKVEAEANESEDDPFFEEVSGDDPLVLELEERLRKMNNNKDLTLEMVLNPATIINTERAVILLRAELMATPEENVEERKKLEDKIEEKQMKIVNEMRQVMTDSLKLEFLLQGILSVPLFGAFCYDAWPFLPDLEWLGLDRESTSLTFRLLGLWGIWLVTIPALRARKPGGPYGLRPEEKRALDVSFLITPFLCILVPFFSKDPAVTFWASVVCLAGCYVWSFNTPLVATASSRRGAAQDLDLPEPVTWALRALDFGTGSERGQRSEDTSWQSQLSAYEEAAEALAKAKIQQRKKDQAESDDVRAPAKGS